MDILHSEKTYQTSSSVMDLYVYVGVFGYVFERFCRFVFMCMCACVARFIDRQANK